MIPWFSFITTGIPVASPDLSQDSWIVLGEKTEVPATPLQAELAQLMVGL